MMRRRPRAERGWACPVPYQRRRASVRACVSHGWRVDSLCHLVVSRRSHCPCPDPATAERNLREGLLDFGQQLLEDEPQTPQLNGNAQRTNRVTAHPQLHYTCRVGCSCGGSGVRTMYPPFANTTANVNATFTPRASESLNSNKPVYLRGRNADLRPSQQANDV